MKEITLEEYISNRIKQIEKARETGARNAEVLQPISTFINRVYKHTVQ